MMTTATIALQLYTVRDETARDFAGTLRRAGAMGYDGVEFAGYGGLPAHEVRALLEETGLRAASTHVGLDLLEGNLEAEIDYCLAIGCPCIVLPWLPSERRGPAALRALAPLLDEVGRRCHDHGLAFGYHNHDFEFARDGGDGGDSDTMLLDRLLDATDPALVALELDVYWAAYAGVDPVALLRRYAGRVPLLHIKDMASDRGFTEVGDGTLDLSAVLRAAGDGVRWLIVENDAPRIASLESARRSLENLRALVAA